MLYKPLINTLIIGLSVSALSMLLGGMLAWLVTRADIPFRKFFSFIIVVPHMLPSWYKALAWITIFKNERIGGAPGLLYIFGIDTPNWLAYGMLPIILVLSIHYFAFTYLLVTAALSSIGGDVEEMAEITGASRFTILRKITFPLVLPALLSALILTFSRAIGTFGVPAFLGLKVGFFVIPTQLYSSIRNRFTVNAYILSIILIFISLITMYINQRAIGKRKSYSTITGKATRATLVNLKKWKYPVVVLMFLFVFIAVVIPVVILLLQTFLLRDGVYRWDNFTTDFWIGVGSELYNGLPGIFRNPEIITILGKTLKLVFLCSVIATLCGLILGYVILRGRRTSIGRTVDTVTFLPYLIPSISFGAIYLSMFSKQIGFLPSLYGTLALLVLISVVKYLPFSTRTGVSNMLQISSELEEAAVIEGARFGKRFSRIILPIAKKGMVSGFMLTFISSIKELDLIVLLVTPALTTLTALTYRFSENGLHQFSDAVISIVVVIVLVVYFVAVKVFKADIAKGLGG